MLAFFLKYFWFMLIAFGAGNAWFIQQRAKPLIANSPDLKAHANKVSVTLVLMIGIPSALLGSIQLIAGYASPFYIFSDDLSNGYLICAWIVMAALRLFILWWAWRTTGIESYLLITPVRFKKPVFLQAYSSALIARWLITLIVLSWFASVFLSFV